MNCSKAIKKINGHEISDSELRNCKAFILTVNCINIQSICALNIFSKNCQTLIVNSFLNSSGMIKTTKELEYFNRQINEFPLLNEARFKFRLHDRKQEKDFIWNDIYLNVFLKSHFIKLCKHVRKLRLECYQSSARSLVKTLRYLLRNGDYF